MKKTITLSILIFGLFLTVTGQEPELVSSTLTFEVRGQSVAVLNNILYFPGHSGDFDSELWRSDGTEAGTYEVMDLNPAGRAYPHSFEVVNNVLFFIADSLSVTKQLFKTDGTEGGTEWIADVDDAGIENNHMLTESGGLLFYRTYRPTIGLELWVSDGTSEGTDMVKDICENQPSYPHELTDFKDILIFAAEDCEASPNALYRSDATSANTLIIGGNNPSGIIVAGDTLYFSNTFTGFGSELARSTGLPGTIEMADEINPGGSGSSIYHLTQVDTLVFFRAYHSDYGSELWAYNQNTGKAYLVKDIWPGSSGSSFPDELISYNGKLIFQAHDGTYGQELWISDGTEEGTYMLKNINEEPGGTPYGHSYPSKFYEAAGRLYFSANDGTNGTELWQTDGTAEGTSMVYNLGYLSNSSDPGSFTEIDGYLYFHAYYNGQYRLYKLELPDPPTSLAKTETKSTDKIFEIYPNPAEDEIILKNPSGHRFIYTINNIQGKEIMAGKCNGNNEVTLNISGLKPGTYFFAGSNKNLREVVKFVKK
ncbi:T9SS type A sorting domain-containing protein [Marinilabilia rubra]|uniref:Secretion system C-terminal sorting domain-containing protein n=1 Tax=Marinilabilia rubra TaxID=2162893 RepID=A0A2U2B8Z4_9BACT|nr:T9SS type A sorting domain-containing protein [Marinilabilia rubra]PWD99522.1 hypothetical protein DDZ16_11000 [Marinilabilia rubra]